MSQMTDHVKSNPLPGKRVDESRSQQVQIVLGSHINGFGRLFGGQLVSWIDTVGAVVARRHCGREVTTASIDNLQFREGVLVNSLVVLKGCMTYVGRTSMEVRVDTFTEDTTGRRRLVNSTHMVFVALDENMKPASVPPLILETIQQKEEYEMAKKRQQLRLQRRQEGF